MTHRFFFNLIILVLITQSAYALEPRPFLEDADFYEVIGADRSMTAQQIRRAWQRAIIKFHPDHADPGESEAYNLATRRIVQAGLVLNVPDLRRRYDLSQVSFDSASSDAASIDFPRARIDLDVFKQYALAQLKTRYPGMNFKHFEVVFRDGLMPMPASGDFMDLAQLMLIAKQDESEDVSAMFFLPVGERLVGQEVGASFGFASYKKGTGALGIYGKDLAFYLKVGATEEQVAALFNAVLLVDPAAKIECTGLDMADILSVLCVVRNFSNPFVVMEAARSLPFLRRAEFDIRFNHVEEVLATSLNLSDQSGIVDLDSLRTVSLDALNRGFLSRRATFPFPFENKTQSTVCVGALESGLTAARLGGL